MPKKTKTPFYDFIGRSAVILKPKKALFQWIQGLSQTYGLKDFTFEDVCEDPQVFLIPDFDTREEFDRFLDLHAGDFLKITLADWTANPEDWPPKLDAATLNKLFTLEVLSEVLDFNDADLEDEFFQESPDEEE